MKYEITKGSEKDFEGAPEWVMQVESLIDSNALFYTEAINGSQTAKHLCQWSDEFITRQLAHSANSIGGGFTVIAQRRPITEPELKPIYGDGIHDDSEALQQRIDMGIDVSNIIGEQGKLFNISKPLQFGVVKDSVVNQQLTTEWDGEGLPPVGCHCEVKAGKDSWNLCKVVFSDDAAGVAFVYLGGDEGKYVGSVDCIGAVCAPSYFRYVRSPEDVARDEFIKELSGIVIEGSSIGTKFAAALYDAGYRKMEGK